MNEPEEIAQPEDIRRKIEERAAVARGDLWERMGCPASKLHMPIDEYMKSFRGRHWFANKTVFEQAQLTLQIIICPNCIKDAKHGGVEGTQFFTTVEDDVMTVFPAMGHFLCHWCGFEEYHPLKTDPRIRRYDANMGQESYFDQKTRRFVNQTINPPMGPGLGSAFGGVLNNGMSATEHQMRAQQAQAQLAQLQQAYTAGAIGLDKVVKDMDTMPGVGKGIEPGMGPIWGMTDDERIALQRLYQKTLNKQAPPPKIVQSREEAEMLLKLAPIERRQAIVQKLRDMGVLIK